MKEFEQSKLENFKISNSEAPDSEFQDSNTVHDFEDLDSEFDRNDVFDHEDLDNDSELPHSQGFAVPDFETEEDFWTGKILKLRSTMQTEEGML